MDEQTLSVLLRVAATKGDNVVASYMAAKAAERVAKEERDKVTTASLDEIRLVLGLDREE